MLYICGAQLMNISVILNGRAAAGFLINKLSASQVLLKGDSVAKIQ